MAGIICDGRLSTTTIMLRRLGSVLERLDDQRRSESSKPPPKSDSDDDDEEPGPFADDRE